MERSIMLVRAIQVIAIAIDIAFCFKPEATQKKINPEAMIIETLKIFPIKVRLGIRFLLIDVIII